MRDYGWWLVKRAIIPSRLATVTRTANNSTVNHCIHNTNAVITTITTATWFNNMATVGVPFTSLFVTMEMKTLSRSPSIY